MSENTETLETGATAETTATATGVNVVKMEDGSERDFGKKGQIHKEVTIDAEGIKVKLMLVTGKIKNFLFGRDNALFDTMASRGVIEFLGNSAAGVYVDKEGLHPEDLDIAIEKAIAALESGVIPTRERGASETKGLGDLIRAYAELRNEAKDADGNFRFSEEDRNADTIKALIVSADEATNKARLAQPTVKAKIEGYKLERQQAKAAAAAKAVDLDADLI